MHALITLKRPIWRQLTEAATVKQLLPRREAASTSTSSADTVVILSSHFQLVEKVVPLNWPQPRQMNEMVMGPCGPKAAPNRTCSINFGGHSTVCYSSAGLLLRQPQAWKSSHPALISF